MYNGVGLQTSRGSGTNGYVQSNKFFMKPKLSEVVKAASGTSPWESGGVSPKPNEDILEHDRKRQVELKLLVLEEKLADQDFTDSDIAEKLDEARRDLLAAEDGADAAAPFVMPANKVSHTKTHQVAARKEKQMEAMRAALGIRRGNRK